MGSKTASIDVEFDKSLLLSYEMGKLSLEPVPDIEKVLLPLEVTVHASSNISKEDKISLINTTGKLCDTKLDKEIKTQKDINGNEEFTNLENLNNSVSKLDLSDSEDEEENKKSGLRERGPIRTRRQAYKLKKNTFAGSNIDRSMFNHDKLKFLSGVTHVEINDTRFKPSLLLDGTDLTDCLSENRNIISPDINKVHYTSSWEQFSNSYDMNLMDNCFDSFVEDSSLNSVSDRSPESGYDTASVSSSPPHSVWSSSNLSAISEIDEQNVLNIILEIESSQNYGSSAQNLLPFDLDDKNYKEKLIDLLKNVPVKETDEYDFNKEWMINEQYSSIVNEQNLQSETSEPEEIISISENSMSKINKSLQQGPGVNEYFQKQPELACVIPAASDESVDSKQKLSNIGSTVDVDYISTGINILPDDKREHVPLINTSDLKTSVKKTVTQTTGNDSISNQRNLNNSAPRIACMPLKDAAKNALRQSLSPEKFHIAQAKIYKRITEDKQKKKSVRIIFVEDEEDKASENQTNLHLAVLNSKIEEIYCLVEVHKQNNGPFSDLNLRDKNRKTALDYALEKNLYLVVDYLKENNACQSPHV